MGTARRQRLSERGTRFAEEVWRRNRDEEDRRQAKEEYLRRKAREWTIAPLSAAHQEEAGEPH